MKRASTSLVSYSSSSSDESEPSAKLIPTRSKLPPLAASLALPVPADDPTKHQGRIRSFPHVEGQYATYVYFPLVLGPGEALYDLVTDVVSKAKEEVGGLWGVGEAGREDRRNAKLELHISLSRPIFLRAHQRDDFKRAVKRIAESVSPFSASFSTFSELTNDERTRTFLSMEVGAGHVEFCHILKLLAPTLRSLRQKEFYADPRFHASIAWALLDSLGTCPSPGIATSARGSPSNTSTPTDSMSELDLDRFPRIPHLPPTLISTLNASYAPRLSAARTGAFLVDKIAVRIGKEIGVWCLSGIGRVA
ncbi:hypothetical protein PISMIDRAFT_124007 [Pisolithus microcarpus 441]|uniref:U6 snRNA phosphodiesterase n=1 Tax=Pisolithus microcarpus 441 TaxID=765257 RepID=A0A0C9Y0I9_9AGAM|nr:hypothetical protein PISMIDRAFT_124007 [Pisolithus microcarpus 441]